jgi:hypothetical protein
LVVGRLRPDIVEVAEQPPPVTYIDDDVNRTTQVVREQILIFGSITSTARRRDLPGERRSFAGRQEPMTMMTLEQYLTPDPNLRAPRECPEFMPDPPPSLASREMSLNSAISVHGYLNARRVQRDRLYRAGIIVPRPRGDGAADQFAPEDLDAFLARLLAGAEPVVTAAEGQVTIPQAAHRAFCMSEDIVRLVLDGSHSDKR